MTKEALKLALEALEVANSCVDGYYIPKGKTHLPEIELAITAIKEALAQPEQEPVAYINVEQRKLEWAKYMSWDTPTVVNLPKIPLYITPPQRKPLTIEQPKVRTGDCLLVGVCASEGHKIQPQRTWVGLERKIATAVLEHCYSPMAVTSDMIERTTEVIKAKLKEKNNG
jgi:hypothetical protein